MDCSGWDLVDYESVSSSCYIITEKHLRKEDVIWETVKKFGFEDYKQRLS